MKNGAVYVSALPHTITTALLHTLFSKAGIIMDSLHDPSQPRIKLYESENAALVVYLREESVQLAIDLLDGVEVDGHVIRVERASFDRAPVESQVDSTDGNTNTNPGTNRLDRDTWKRRMEKMNSKLAWQDDTLLAVLSVSKRLKYECTCLLYNMVSRERVERDPELLLAVEEDVREEAGRVGIIKAVVVMAERGVVAVRFEHRESAVLCRDRMDGRFYDGQRVVARLYDGSFKIHREKQISSSGDQSGDSGDSDDAPGGGGGGDEIESRDD
jgi:hypothetical protein